MAKNMNVRGSVLRIIAVSSVAVLLIVAAVIVGARVLPELRQNSLERALEAGNTERARRIAGRLDEENQSEALRQCCYIEAEELMAEGKYAEASQLYAEAGDYSDASEKRRSCDYEYAALLESSGDLDAAIEFFRSLGAYSDAADRLVYCRYEKATLLVETGEKQEAARLLDEISSLPEALELLTDLAVELTGIEDTERALAAFRGMSEEQLALQSQLSEIRAGLPENIIDVGFYHTVGLGTDGKVYSCGDNSCGQCDTGNWNNAAAVAAGAWHTAALLNDGTVVCTGRNDENQCDTGEWTDIIQIAASDYATFGLKADGTVLSTGLLDYEEIKTWTEIVSITAGSYNIAAVRSDGSLWFYPEMTGCEQLEKAESLSVSTGYGVALLSDGSAVCSGIELPSWESLVAVSAGNVAVIAIKADGTVEAYFFRQRDTIDFSDVKTAVAAAAGGTHHALVLSDGSVKVFGDTSSGQGETESWILKVD